MGIELEDHGCVDLEDRSEEAARIASADRRREDDCSGVVRPWFARHEAFVWLMFAASLDRGGMKW